MFWVETFFEGIIHGVDGGFARFVALHGGDIGVLDEEENKKKSGEGDNDDKF